MSDNYEDWIKWPLADIIEFADEIADSVNLPEDLRADLRSSMWGEAGYGSWMKQGPWPRYFDFPRIPYFTREVPEDEEGWSDDEWLEMCRRYNEPIASTPRADDEGTRPLPQDQWEIRGDGLTKRWVLKRDGVWEHERRGGFQREPFSRLAGNMYGQARALLWRTNHYCVGHSDYWLGPVGMNEPYVGLYWHYARMNRWRRASIHFARSASPHARQIEMFCAAQMAKTFTEMELRAQHNDQFVKDRRVRESQSDGGRRNQKAPPEVLRDAWRKYRRDGYTSTEAGIQAGEEYGVSERTVRRAFKNGYPEIA